MALSCWCCTSNSEAALRAKSCTRGRGQRGSSWYNDAQEASSALGLAGNHRSHTRTLQVDPGDRRLARCWRSPGRQKERSVNRYCFTISNPFHHFKPWWQFKLPTPTVKNSFSYSQRSPKHFKTVWQLPSSIDGSAGKTPNPGGAHTCGKEGLPGKLCHPPHCLHNPRSQHRPVSVSGGAGGMPRIKARLVWTGL